MINKKSYEGHIITNLAGNRVLYSSHPNYKNMFIVDTTGVKSGDRVLLGNMVGGSADKQELLPWKSVEDSVSVRMISPGSPVLSEGELVELPFTYFAPKSFRTSQSWLAWLYGISLAMREGRRNDQGGDYYYADANVGVRVSDSYIDYYWNELAR